MLSVISNGMLLQSAINNHYINAKKIVKNYLSSLYKNENKEDISVQRSALFFIIS